MKNFLRFTPNFIALLFTTLAISSVSWAQSDVPATADQTPVVQDITQEFSESDRQALLDAYHLDIDQVPCEKFREIYNRERLGFWGTFGSYFVPGLAQYKRGEFLKGAAYTTVGYGLSAASFFAENFYTKMLLGAGAVFVSGFSIYDAKVSNRFGDQRFFNTDKNSMKNVFAAPFDVSLLKKRAYLFPVFGMVAVGATIARAAFLGHPVVESLFSQTALSAFYRFMTAAGVSYMAATGEEMLFRGTLLPIFEESLLRQQLLTQDEIQKNSCQTLTIANLMDRIEKLPVEQQKEVRASAKVFPNLFQSVFFTLAHDGLNPLHFFGGVYLGSLATDEPSHALDQGIFAHFWYDLIVLGSGLLVF